jgi:iron complex transport system substrate-binding protein
VIAPRLRPVIVAAVASLALLLAGCAGSGTPSSEQAEPTTPSASGGSFPVSITHSLGTTEIEAAPERVVSLGYTDQDTILALGVVPVAIREFTGNQPSATWPWAQSALQGQSPEVLSGDISAEQLAALTPDLIVAVSAGLTQEQYDLYSNIAPVITQPVGAVAFQTPWQDTTEIIGQALGRETEAQSLVEELEARFDEVRAEYPQLEGANAAVAALSSNGGAQYFVYTGNDYRARFFEDLGLTRPAVFDERAAGNFYAEISTEELGLLDQNQVLGWIGIPGTPNSAIEDQPGYPALQIGQQGRVLDLTEEQGVAMSFSSVLSLPSLLDTVPGELAARLGG